MCGLGLSGIRSFEVWGSGFAGGGQGWGQFGWPRVFRKIFSGLVGVSRGASALFEDFLGV